MHSDNVGSCVIACQCSLTNSDADKIRLDMASSNVMNANQGLVKRTLSGSMASVTNTLYPSSNCDGAMDIGG